MRVLCLVLTFSTLVKLTSPQAVLPPFPHVYNTVASSSSIDLDLDIIDVQPIGEDSKRFTILVHHETQLEELSIDLEFDSEGTRAIHHELEYNNNSNDEKEEWEKDGRRLRHTKTKTKNKKNLYLNIRGYSCYRSLEGSFQTMSTLAAKAEAIPNLSVILKDVGDSWLKTQDQTMGRDIWALEITGEGVLARGRTTEKGVIFVMSGIHAREYAPPELVARWAEHLVFNYGHDADITSLLDHTEVHIIMQVNPDGREVAERRRIFYKRKNMNNGTSGCFLLREMGVDLNRNFPAFWGEPGSSRFGCSETYRGKSPASEPEVQAVVNYVRSIFPKEQQNFAYSENVAVSEYTKGVFLDYHAFGSVILYPWNHAQILSENHDDFLSLVGKLRHFNGYGFSGPDQGFMYPSSGDTGDFGYAALGAASLTIELGKQFYQNCRDFESTIVPENLPSMNYAAKISRMPFRYTKGPDIIQVGLSYDQHSMVSIQAVASDSMWASAGHASSKQVVVAIRVFVDDHPDDHFEGKAPKGEPMHDIRLDESATSATLALDLLQFSPGRHTLYLQALDSAGYEGPITAVWFEAPSSGEDPS